jgi:hypothetical protein
MARITINGVSLDPLEQSDALKEAGLESVDASQSNYVLIQTRAPLTAEEKTQLADLGVLIGAGALFLAQTQPQLDGLAEQALYLFPG